MRGVRSRKRAAPLSKPRAARRPRLASRTGRAIRISPSSRGRGDESWTLRTTGTPAHSSQIFQKDVGAGAVYEATRVLSEFYKQLSGERYLTFNPGLALGGTAGRLDSTGVAGDAEGKSNVVAE